MDYVDDLCTSLAHNEIDRQQFIRRALRTGVGMATIGSLLKIYTGPGAHAAADSLHAPTAASNFNWKKYAGTTIHVNFSKHPYSNAAVADLASFKKLTGINAVVNFTPEQEYFDKLQLNLAGKSTELDVFMLGAYMAWQYGPPGYCVDLSQYIKDASVTSPDFNVTDFFPVVMRNDSWNGVAGTPPGVGDAKQWAFPWGWEQNVLTYRRDLFQKHGIAVPTTYAGVLQAAMKLKKAEPSLIPFLARGQLSWDTIHPGYLSGLYSYGGRDFNSKLQPIMNSAPAVKFTDTFINLIKNYGPPPGRWTGYGVFDVSAAMGAGEVGMFHDATVLGYSADLPGASKIGGKGLMGWAPSPNNGGSNHGSNIWIWSLGMNSASQHKEAAWYFIQWATSRQHLAFAAPRGHADTVRQSVYNTAAYQDLLAQHYNYKSTINSMLGESHIEFTPQPFFFTTTTSWAGALQDIYAGKTSTKAGLDSLTQKISAQLSQAGLTK